MFRQLLLLAFLAVTLVTCRPNVLDGSDAKPTMPPKIMDPKTMPPKIMEQTTMPPKVMEGKVAEAKSADAGKGKGSDVNDGGRLLSLPEADACANSTFSSLQL